MSYPDQIVTFDQMKGAIGSLVWLWSEIEKELRVAIQRLQSDDPPKPVQGIRRSLDVWSTFILDVEQGRELQIHLCTRLKDALTEALAIRNLVCHGLIDITAKLHPTGREAHLTVELSDDRRILTWSELETMFGWMSQAKWVIRDLTDAAIDRDAARGSKTLAAWQGFPRRN
jgi:hypothetical protein